MTELVLTVLTFLTELALTVLIFLTERALTSLTFLSELALNALQCDAGDLVQALVANAPKPRPAKSKPAREQDRQVGYTYIYFVLKYPC